MEYGRNGLAGYGWDCSYLRPGGLQKELLLFRGVLLLERWAVMLH